MTLQNAGSASLKVKHNGTFVAGSTSSSYTRPSDWLTLPTVTSGEQKFVGLAAVHQNYDNWVAVNCAAAYTVDWGDGTTQNVAANTTVSKNLAWASYSSTTLSSRGYRQAIITITPQSGQNLTKVDLTALPSNTTANLWTAPWLDIRMAGSNVTSLSVGSSSSARSLPGLLEQFEYVGTNGVTSFSSAFYSCNSLVKVVSLYTNASTNFSAMFQNCSSLRELPSLNTAAGTNFSSMFSGCVSLVTAPTLDTAAGTSFGSMFSGCNSLQTVPAFNTASAAASNLQSVFSGCYSLRTVPISSIGSATRVDNLFANCWSLQEIPALDLTNVTIYTSWVSTCRLKKISATGFNATFTVANQQLQATELNAIYTALSASGAGKTITVTGNPGTATDDPTIATAKGWTVTG